MKTILMAAQAKQAREEAKLSQGKVSSELGLNRTYLSLFESGKYVFDDATLQAMRDFYESYGVVLTSEKTDSGALRVKDGFIVPDAVDEGAVEELLSRYADNKKQILQICSKEPGRGLFGGVDADDVEERQFDILQLMARNFALIEELQGHPTITPCSLEVMGENKENMGGYLSELFSDLDNQSPSEFEGEDAA